MGNVRLGVVILKKVEYIKKIYEGIEREVEKAADNNQKNISDGRREQ